VSGDAAASRIELDHHVQVSQDRSDRLDERLDGMESRMRVVETTLASGFAEVKSGLAEGQRTVKMFGSFLSVGLTLVSIVIAVYAATK